MSETEGDIALTVRFTVHRSKIVELLRKIITNHGLESRLDEDGVLDNFFKTDFPDLVVDMAKTWTSEDSPFEGVIAYLDDSDLLIELGLGRLEDDLLHEGEVSHE